MPKINHHISLETKRKMRIRSKLHGTSERPRLSLYRSNMHTYLQVIDDVAGKTLASAHDKAHFGKMTKTERAVAAAKSIAEQLQKQNIKALVFDRGGYRYHGRVKAVADAMRAAGVEV